MTFKHFLLASVIALYPLSQASAQSTVPPNLTNGGTIDGARLKMQLTGPAGISNASPFGTFNTSTALSVTMNYGTKGSLAQSNGYKFPYQLSFGTERDQVALELFNQAPPLLATLTGTTYTATSVTPATPLSGSVVTAIQQSLTECAYQSAVFASVPANVCMIIDTAAGLSGSISAVAADGSSITVTGWYAQGNTAPGQVPANGDVAYVNPVNHSWVVDGLQYLNANSYAKWSIFMEADLYNQQGTYASGSIMNGVSMNCDGTYDCGYAFQALGPHNWGFYSTQTIGHPFAHCITTSNCDFSVGSNGTVIVGSDSVGNGLNMQAVASGSPVIIQAHGIDANINLRLVPKGTGTVRFDSGIQNNGTGLNQAYTSSANVNGFTSTNDSGNGFQVLHNTTDPAWGFISYQRSGHPFGASTNDGTNYYWSVGLTGSMTLGDSAANNGFSLGVFSPGSPPVIQAIGPDTNINLRLVPKGTGTVRFDGGLINNGTGLTQAYTSSANTNGFTSTADSGNSFQVLHDAATDPTWGFITYQRSGHPFGASMTNGGSYYFVVGTDGTITTGDSSAAKNGFIFAVSASGSAPYIASQGADTNINVRVVPKGTGALVTPLLNVNGSPALVVAPTGNPGTTYSSLNVQGTSVAGNSSREFLLSCGLTINNANGTGVNEGNVCGYFGVVANSGAGNAWSVNTLITLNSGFSGTGQGIELDFNNASGTHMGDAAGVAGLTGSAAYGLTLTGSAAYRATSAILIIGNTTDTGPMWNRGITFANGSINQVAIADYTHSPIFADIRGVHTTMIDGSNGTTTNAAIWPLGAPMYWGSTSGPRIVSSTSGSEVSIGLGNALGGATGTIVLGGSNAASGDYSVTVGNGGWDRGRTRTQVFSSGRANGNGGSSQVVHGEPFLRTTDTLAHNLLLDGSTSQTATNCFNLSDNSVIVLDVRVNEYDSTTGNAATWESRGVMITRDTGANTIALQGSPTFTLGQTRGSLGGTVVWGTPDTTNGCVPIRITAPSSNATDWVAHITSLETQ
jgi:hypothetical protein